MSNEHERPRPKETREFILAKIDLLLGKLKDICALILQNTEWNFTNRTNVHRLKKHQGKEREYTLVQTGSPTLPGNKILNVRKKPDNYSFQYAFLVYGTEIRCATEDASGIIKYQDVTRVLKENPRQAETLLDCLEIYLGELGGLALKEKMHIGMETALLQEITRVRVKLGLR